MALKHKGRALFVGVISALGCLSADLPDNQFEVVFGKASLNRDIPFHVEYFNESHPVVDFSYQLYLDRSKANLLYESTAIHFNIKDHDNRWVHDETISKTFLQENPTLYCLITFDAYEDTWWFPDHKTYYATVWIPDIADSISVVNPEPNTEIPVARYVDTFKNGSLSVTHDSYYIGNWRIDTSGNLYHGINLASATLGYSDASGNKAMTGNALLKIYTKPLEWNIGELNMENGQFYRTIPLSFESSATKTLSGRKYRIYKPRLADSYSVDRSTLKMYPVSDSTKGTEYFQSKDLFIPIKNKSESTTFKFRITWFALNGFDDRFDYDYSIQISSRLFGNCSDSEYCVGLGNE